MSGILVSVAYVAVILTGKSSLDLLAKPSVFEGMYVSGMRATPWNELVEPVHSERLRTK